MLRFILVILKIRFLGAGFSYINISTVVLLYFFTSSDTTHSFQLFNFFLYFFAPTTTTGGGDCTRYGRRKTRNRYTSPGFRDSEEQRFLSSYSSRSFSYSVLIFWKKKKIKWFWFWTRARSKITFGHEKENIKTIRNNNNKRRRRSSIIFHTVLLSRTRVPGLCAYTCYCDASHITEHAIIIVADIYNLAGRSRRAAASAPSVPAPRDSLISFTKSYVRRTTPLPAESYSPRPARALSAGRPSAHERFPRRLLFGVATLVIVNPPLSRSHVRG